MIRLNNKHWRGEKKLNHLMEVFNDAWRNLDLCFTARSRGFSTVNVDLKTHEEMEDWNRMPKKGQNFNFIEEFFASRHANDFVPQLGRARLARLSLSTCTKVINYISSSLALNSLFLHSLQFFVRLAILNLNDSIAVRFLKPFHLKYSLPWSNRDRFNTSKDYW